MESTEKGPTCPINMWTQIQNAIALRSSQDQVLWSIFGTFWAANAILLVALFTTGDLPKNRWVGIVISAVGLAIALVWRAIQKRALGHIARLEELIRKIEEDLRVEPRLAVSAEINREDYQRYVGKSIFSARTVMPLCSAGSAFLWIVAMLFFTCRCTY
ncbi:MAG TPA: hypothetical protein VMX16_04030 [Terriglobia bacterium]|nr:hypothetical protein [Terriglobia bacterium]